MSLPLGNSEEIIAHKISLIQGNEVVDIVDLFSSAGEGGGYTHPATHSIAEVSGLQTALNAKANASDVLTAVPANALFTDTVYTHPATHSISEVSGLQAALQDKANASDLLTAVPAGALFSDTVYTHPASHSISEVSGLQTALNAKAGAVATTTELELRYTKIEVDSGFYSRDQVDARLQDKANASDLLSPVPAGVLFTDTVYTHPATHSIAEVSGLQTALNAKANSSDVLTAVPAGAVFIDTVYSHPATHSIAEVSGLQAALNGKQALLSNAAYLDATSSVQGQLNGKQSLLSNASFLDATSSIQGQLATKAGAVAVATELGMRYTKLEVDANTYTQAQVDDRLNDKANASTTYTISEVDANTYTQSQVDDRLNDKADTATTYTITQVDANTYSRDQVDDRLDNKANAADMLQVLVAANTWAEPLKMHFDNSTFALDVAPGSATMGAWIVDPTPPMSSVVGLTAALAGKQSTISDTLTLGSTAPMLTLAKGTNQTTYTVDGGGSSVINWDASSSGSSYFGIKHSGSWQTWLTTSNGSWVTSSDSRLKNVLGQVENACDKLRSVQTVFFDFKADPSKTRKLGLIAQEVQAICPEIVTTGPDGHLGLAYQDTTPLLLAAIKELTARVEALETSGTRKGRAR